MRKIAILMIEFYKLCISPFLGANCRFSPTCSQYSKQCFERFSFFKALNLTIRRLSKCHPYNEGGHDPVPEDSKKPKGQ